MWRIKKEYIERKMKYYMYKGNIVLLKNVIFNMLKELIIVLFMIYF